MEVYKYLNNLMEYTIQRFMEFFGIESISFSGNLLQVLIGLILLVLVIKWVYKKLFPSTEDAYQIIDNFSYVLTDRNSFRKLYSIEYNYQLDLICKFFNKYNYVTEKIIQRAFTNPNRDLHRHIDKVISIEYYNKHIEAFNLSIKLKHHSEDFLTVITFYDLNKRSLFYINDSYREIGYFQFTYIDIFNRLKEKYPDKVLQPN